MYSKIQNNVPLYIVESLYVNAVDEVLKEYNCNTLTEGNLSWGRGHVYARDKLIKKLLYWLEDKEEINNSKEKREQMKTLNERMEEFLNNYYNLKKNRIIDKYNELITQAKEKSNKEAATKLIQKIASNSYKIDVSKIKNCLPDGYAENELSIAIQGLKLIDKNNEEVKLCLSEEDKTALSGLATLKNTELGNLNELLSQVKMLILTCESDHDFKEILTAYNIIDKTTGRLIV